MENRSEITVTTILFIVSSLIWFFALSTSGVGLETLFSVAITLNLDEIASSVKALIPLILLFPLSFAILSVDGIKTKRKHIWIPGVIGAVISVTAGAFIFGTDLVYTLFSVGYVISAGFCGHWVNVRYRELKSMKAYRSTTSAVSKSLLITNLGIIIGIFITIQANPIYAQSLLDKSIESYAAISIEFGKHQMDSQIRDNIDAQTAIQKSVYSNLTQSIATVFNALGVKEIERLRGKQLNDIGDINLSQEEGDKITDRINHNFDSGRDVWHNEVNKTTTELVRQYSQRLDDPSFKEELKDKYYGEFSSRMLDKEKMKEQIEHILRVPITIDNKEVIIYDFLRTTLPIAVAFFAFMTLNLCRRLILTPLAAGYTSILVKILLIKKRKEENELQSVENAINKKKRKNEFR